MKKYIVENFDAEQFELLLKDIGEIEILLEIPDLREKFVFTLESQELYINLPTSVFRYIKGTIQGFWQEGKLLDNSLGMVLLKARQTETYKQELQQQVMLLKEEAEPLYSSVTSSSLNVALPPVEELQYGTILQNLIHAGHKRFVIAEGSHAYYAPKKFIMDNIHLLREIEAIVVIENFVFETAQIEMESCIENRRYSTALRHMTPGFPKSDMHLAIKFVEAAADSQYIMLQMLCENGITMVAGDNEASQSLLAGKDRLIVGNYIMLKNTSEFIKAKGYKSEPIVLYFTGGAHAIRTQNVFGISELTGAVVLELHDEYRKDNLSSITPHSKHPMSLVVKRNLTDLFMEKESKQKIKESKEMKEESKQVAATTTLEVTAEATALPEVLGKFTQQYVTGISNIDNSKKTVGSDFFK